MKHNITRKLNGICCLYKITNILNGKIYIGSTNNLMYRNNYHTWHLRNNTHYNPKLQGSWNKHGEESFLLEIILECDQSVLFKYEQMYLDYYKPYYNISPRAEVPNWRGNKRDPEIAKKISISNTGKKRTPEQRARIGLSAKGRTYSPETHALWSKQRMGHEKRAKWHVGLISPLGEVFAPIFNMAKFCREHGINRSKVQYLESGRYNQHRGWTLYKEGA